MMKISNVPSLTFKTPRVYINMTDNPIKVHTREHYTAIPNHDITLQYASILKKKKKKKCFKVTIKAFLHTAVPGYIHTQKDTQLHHMHKHTHKISN